MSASPTVSLRTAGGRHGGDVRVTPGVGDTLGSSVGIGDLGLEDMGSDVAVGRQPAADGEYLVVLKPADPGLVCRAPHRAAARPTECGAADVAISMLTDGKCGRVGAHRRPLSERGAPARVMKLLLNLMPARTMELAR
jgi:hypothetical protein